MREREQTPGEEGLPGVVVEAQVIPLGHHGDRPVPEAAHHCLDPREQHRLAVGLDDVVVDPRPERGHQGRLLTACGHGDDRDVAGGTDVAAQRQTVLVGEAHVEQDQVGLGVEQPRLRGRRRSTHVQVGLLQGRHERGHHAVVVLDQQNPHATSSLCKACAPKRLV